MSEANAALGKGASGVGSNRDHWGMLVIIALLLVALLSRTDDPEITLYPLSCDRSDGKCANLVWQEAWLVRVSFDQQFVVFRFSDGSINKQDGCLVLNAKNWQCPMRFYVQSIEVRNGQVVNQPTSVIGWRFVPWWKWKTAEIASYFGRK